MLRHFQPRVVKDPYGPLLMMRQLGLVMDYMEEFEKIFGPKKYVDKEIMKGIFINGLKLE